MAHAAAVGRIRKINEDPLLARAKAMRREDTEAEAQLWRTLRARRLGGWKWRRQVPLERYIVDFLCHDAALVVELDGGQHDVQVDYVARRTAFLGAVDCGCCGSGTRTCSRTCMASA